ncbi:MAG: radical SAM protein [Candidatus Hydrogenedentes bacterium]|nr:radical SAM protein [Candidatus Hydrogenedentota bacterium]
MKILFSNPPWWDAKCGAGSNERYRAGVRAGSRWPFTGWVASKPDQFQFGDYLPYPFFMGYAATYVAREAGAQVRLRDSIALRESYQAYLEHVEAEQYDYVFIESATPSWHIDQKIIGSIHRLCPRTRIVVTGPITAAAPEKLLEEHPVHACIQGEYEKGGVRVVSGASGVIPHDLLTEAEMNAAPFPYYDEATALRYWDGNPRGQQAPHAQVWSSRGCPYKCIFCVWPATMTGNDPDGTRRRTVRQYTAEYMEAFLRELTARYPYRCIYFDDDTFNLGDKHVLKMCEVMQRIGLPWSAMCRADTIKLDTWQAMRDSGCFGVKIGFESGNQYVVDHIVKKRLNLDQARDVVHAVKKLGMTVHGTFTYGLPGETHEQMLETKRFIASLPFDTIQESGTAVIEGTPLNTLLKEGHLSQYDGAQIDEGFRAESDGIKKLHHLAPALQRA